MFFWISIVGTFCAVAGAVAFTVCDVVADRRTLMAQYKVAARYHKGREWAGNVASAGLFLVLVAIVSIPLRLIIGD